MADPDLELRGGGGNDVGAALSSPQHIPDLHQDYAELSPHSAVIPMQMLLWFKYIYTK